MKGTLNNVVIVGRIGALNIREKFINLSVATIHGQRSNEETSWHEVKILGERAVKAVNPILEKGQTVSIVGELRYETWTERDTNQKRKKAFVWAKSVEVIKWNSSNGGGA